MSTQDVKPWEPVRGQWVLPQTGESEPSWEWNYDQCTHGLTSDGWAIRVTLANGQTVIVKAKDQTQ